MSDIVLLFLLSCVNIRVNCSEDMGYHKNYAIDPHYLPMNKIEKARRKIFSEKHEIGYAETGVDPIIPKLLVRDPRYLPFDKIEKARGEIFPKHYYVYHDEIDGDFIIPKPVVFPKIQSCD